MKANKQYVALLRGINVGGHRKVPMADLKTEMKALGFSEVETLLNSGNIVFKAPETKEDSLEKILAEGLETRFGFPIPVLVRKGEEVLQLFNKKPFMGVEVTHDLRLYVSFLQQHPQEIELPWISEDNSFKIIAIEERTVCSILDLSGMGTTKGLEVLERIFGKNITTRNWNTVEKIAAKLET